ncbi:leucine-rich repeat-containing protein 23-like [Harmonia axyridis]|uniref:leucine-rich repeat-containing protein 23-like n=1 Tax=Harmonia axyridis TaxID=115357 RepID=UPI001E278542|nr:leucine-rich repeat-containing protein 23-like [Harmonia axyridis]
MLGEGLPEPEAAPGEDALYKHFLMRGVIVPKILTFDEASKCLSNLGKDESGVRYAYLMLSATDMKLTDISKITCFKHVLFVDVSGNFLELGALQILCEMPFLILLKAERNKITSAALDPCPYLQVLVLNKNQICETDNIGQPYLETLDLSNNLIYEARFQSENLKELKQLELVGNQLVELAGQFPTSLEKIYLAQNRIHKIVASDLSKLVNLKVLHLRENKLHKLDGFTEDLKNLTYLNLRRNTVKQLKQLMKLRCLPKLETLILIDNPVMNKKEAVGEEEEELEGEEDKKDYVRISILAMLPNLKRINKEVVRLEERDEAFFIGEEKIQEIMGEESSDEESILITTTDMTTEYTTETETDAGFEGMEYGG